MTRTERLASIVGLAVFAIWMIRAPHLASDAAAYWVVDPATPYLSATGSVSTWPSFFYAPPLAAFAMELRYMPLALWYLALVGANLAALRVLAARWWLAALVLPPVLLELEFGNVDLLIGAAALLGARYPAAWAFPLLTKVTPGVGLVWFVVRREWRNLAVAIGVTASLCLASFVARPELWPEWLTMLRANVGVSPTGALWIPVPIVVRLPIAAALVAWGARTNRTWVLPVASMLATPTLWFAATGTLVALYRVGPYQHHPLAGVRWLRAGILPDRGPGPDPGA